MDVLAPGASLSIAAQSEMACIFFCRQLAECKASAFHRDNATCWLYPYLVKYTTSGMASPGTRYFWRVFPGCPGELGYQMGAGICFKVYNTVMKIKAAQETCTNDGGHLAIGDTIEKRRAILREARLRWVWLGASDEHVEGKWW